MPKFSKWEKQYYFKWDDFLATVVIEHYGTNEKFFYRLAQIYSESAFNPKATSDFKGWKKQKVDTVTAIYKRMGAAGLTQFVWTTATLFDAKTVDTKQAFADTFAPDIYNPYWSLKSNSRYMKAIEKYLLSTKNSKARRQLQLSREFMELCANASYNTGEARLLDRLNKYGHDWVRISASILPEPKEYAEKIVRLQKEMKNDTRWEQYNKK